MIERMTSPLPIARAAARRDELSNKHAHPKARILAYLRGLERANGVHRWVNDGRGNLVEVRFVTASCDPRRKWTRDELIGQVLDLEFPDFCRWHDQVKPCDACPCRLCNHGQHAGRACAHLVTTASVIDAPCGCRAGASE